MDLEKVEKLLNIKIIDIEEVKGRVFPLFDLAKVHGLRLTLIKDPTFVVVGKEDIYEKKLEGNYIVVDTNDGYIVAKYDGEPNVEALREAEKEADAGGEDGEGSKEHESGRDDVIKEILEKMPKWADGAVVIRKDGNVVVLPIKKSKKGDSYYAAVSWKPIEVFGGIDNLVGHIITKNGKAVKADLRINDKYVNIFIHNTKRSRRNYSRQR